jgi:peptide/nickel transport system substrate-binding protein
MLASARARARAWRPILILAASAAMLLPSALPVAAADPVVLRVGETQDVTAMNPYLATLFSDYEVFTLNYDLLVSYGPDEEPAPGFASSWTQDGTTWTFKIDPNLKWSDGTLATSEDARWTLQTVLDVQARDGYVGSGYLDPYLTYAGVKSVSAPDAQTLVIETETPNTQILTSYLPILPKHIWKDRKIEEDANAVPIVGTGPYQATEWKPGEYVHLVRNPNYSGKQGYADEIFIQYFADEAAMTEAFKAGNIDYARNPTGDQWDSLQGLPGVVPLKSSTASEANAFTELGFNTYSKPIKGGGSSTKALQDPLFRDALGYAIDKPALVEKVLGGKGVPGTTHIPPALGNGKWHFEPQNLRTFDIELAKQKLDAAGYKLDANGKRLDKENKPIALRMVVPDSSATYKDSAQFIAGWWQQLGIDTTTQAYDPDTLTGLMLPPEGKGKADFDVFIWNWGGDVDPNSLLNILTTDAIGSASDSFFSNARYDELMKLQQSETDFAKRKAYTDEMQQIMYDEAPYHVLFYDEALHAYRTDRFGGWKLQPSADGLPFFGYGSYDYTQLTAPEPEATPTPAASAEAPAPGASATPVPAEGGSAGGDSTTLILGVGALVVIGVVAFVLVRRRQTAGSEEEE